MPGHFPGPIGAGAFVGVKLCGYTAAGAVLRRAFPRPSLRPFVFGVVRTVLGIVGGALNLFLWVKLLPRSAMDTGGGALSLVLWQLILWTLVVWYFCDRRFAHPARASIVVACGILLSFLLDAVGIWLALISPGGTPVC